MLFLSVSTFLFLNDASADTTAVIPTDKNGDGGTIGAMGFLLQQNDSLTSTNWINATNAVDLINGTNQVSFVIADDEFFRLHHP